MVRTLLVLVPYVQQECYMFPKSILVHRTTTQEFWQKRFVSFYGVVLCTKMRFCDARHQQDLYYKKTLLCYNLFQSLLASQFLSDPYFIRRIPSFILWYLCVVFHCSVNLRIRVPVVCLRSVAEGSVRTLHDRGGEGEVVQAANFLCRCACKIVLDRSLLH